MLLKLRAYGIPDRLLNLGWTPSTFVSSRQQKAEKHHARPEDFMDEEVNHQQCSLDWVNWARLG